MADAKISQLTEKQTLANDDLLVIASGNNNYKLKGSTVKTYAQGGLATVATSGSYNDLSDKPTIPTVNNATLTVTQNGVSAGTFTANASTDATIAINETIQSASSPLSITSNVLSISTADTTTDGYLTSTDWNKFSNKAVYQTLTEDTTHTTATIAVDNSNFYNKLYRYTQPLTELTLSGTLIETAASTYRYETEIQFTAGTSFTFTANGLVGKWLGVDAPTFEDGSSYVIAVKNGYAVCAKVGA